MARSIKIYYINDGYDGVVCAKNIKQVAALLSAPWAYGGNGGYTKAEILRSLKTDGEYGNYEFQITKVKKVKKKGQYSKAKMLGWIEC